MHSPTLYQTLLEAKLALEADLKAYGDMPETKRIVENIEKEIELMVMEEVIDD